MQHNMLLDNLASVEREKDEIERTSNNLKLIVTAQNMSRKTLSPKKGKESILEDDSIACFDLDKIQSDAQDDLRLSLGLLAKDMPPPRNTRGSRGSVKTERQSIDLLSQLEKSKIEYEKMREMKEEQQKSKIEQQFETTLEMRQTINMLKDEALLKNELLSKYEKRNNKQEEEVSTFYLYYFQLKFYKKQNHDLMRQIGEYEQTISFLNQSHNPFDSEGDSQPNVNTDFQ